MSQAGPEPRSDERPDLYVVQSTDRVPPNGDPEVAPSRVEHTEQSVDSAAGVDRRERVVTDRAGLAHSERTVRDVAGEQRLGLYRATQFIWLLFGIVEGLIGLRVVLKLIGANPDNAFATLIYNAAGLFLAPFIGLIGSPATGRMVLEIPSLIAILIYALLGWVVVQIVRVVWPVFARSTTSSTSTYDRYRS